MKFENLPDIGMEERMRALGMPKGESKITKAGAWNADSTRHGRA